VYWPRFESATWRKQGGNVTELASVVGNNVGRRVQIVKWRNGWKWTESNIRFKIWGSDREALDMFSKRFIFILIFWYFLFIKNTDIERKNRDSVVGIATGYGLDEQGVGVRVPVGARIFSFPRRPDRLWAPPNLLSNGYRGQFLVGKAAVAWSLQLVPRSRKYVSIHPLPHTPSWGSA
jgi:hypothetical protein